jgi:hypothetical protein
MSARNQDQEFERYLRGDAAVSRAYRAAADSEPPAHLDRAIQAAARRAVGGRPRAAFSPFGRRWLGPATAAAAVLVLSVGLVTFLSREGVPLSPGDTTKGLPAETADQREATRPEALGVGQAPSASRRTATAESKQVPAKARETAAAEVRKRNEAASVTESQRTPVGADEVAASKARKAGSETEATTAVPARPSGDVQGSTSPGARGSAVAPRGDVQGSTSPGARGSAVAPRGDVQGSTSPGARGSAPASRELAAAAVTPTSPAATTLADVLSVSTSGAPGAYQFAVTVGSADAGCQLYADWWEVLAEDGRLLYRRVLLHSHVDEQPFTRSGGPVPIGLDTVVWVRAHMHPAGYGGTAMRGSARTGFRPAALPADFSASLAQQAPLPDGCDF